jgi:hypothetical protein
MKSVRRGVARTKGRIEEHAGFAAYGRDFRRSARAGHDHVINLKPEREVRPLHEKLDHLRRTQFERLMKTQQVEIALMQDLRRH